MNDLDQRAQDRADEADQNHHQMISLLSCSFDFRFLLPRKADLFYGRLFLFAPDLFARPISEHPVRPILKRIDY
jgi:hypothetical protein